MNQARRLTRRPSHRTLSRPRHERKAAPVGGLVSGTLTAWGRVSERQRIAGATGLRSAVLDRARLVAPEAARRSNRARRHSMNNPAGFFPAPKHKRPQRGIGGHAEAANLGRFYSRLVVWG